MARRHAFTLVELLVVVAIIALLLSILLPSLEAAREQARTVVCSSHLHDIFSGATIYGNQFNDWVPAAPGGSGAHFADLNSFYGSNDAYDWLDKTYVPTAAWDWASPIAYYGLGWQDLPRDRRKRMEFLREGIFRCASNNFLSRPYPDSANNWPVTTLQSYGSIRAFMYFAYDPNNAANSDSSNYNMPSFFSVRMPYGYTPRFSSMRNASRKAYLAEGIRYHDPVDPAPTYNVEYNARYGGAFSTDGPSSGYSRGFINPVDLNSLQHDPRFDRYSYRHSVRSENGMNALYFDGHAEPLTKREAIVDFDQWWPAGTALQIEGSEVLEFMGGSPNPKPRANVAAMKRRVQEGTPWGEAGWQVIELNGRRARGHGAAAKVVAHGRWVACMQH